MCELGLSEANLRSTARTITIITIFVLTIVFSVVLVVSGPLQSEGDVRSLSFADNRTKPHLGQPSSDVLFLVSITVLQGIFTRHRHWRIT